MGGGLSAPSRTPVTVNVPGASPVGPLPAAAHPLPVPTGVLWRTAGQLQGGAARTQCTVARVCVLPAGAPACSASSPPSGLLASVPHALLLLPAKGAKARFPLALWGRSGWGQAGRAGPAPPWCWTCHLFTLPEGQPCVTHTQLEPTQNSLSLKHQDPTGPRPALLGSVSPPSFSLSAKDFGHPRFPSCCPPCPAWAGAWGGAGPCTPAVTTLRRKEVAGPRHRGRAPLPARSRRGWLSSILIWLTDIRP